MSIWLDLGTICDAFGGRTRTDIASGYQMACVAEQILADSGPSCVGGDDAAWFRALLAWRDLAVNIASDLTWCDEVTGATRNQSRILAEFTEHLLAPQVQPVFGGSLGTRPPECLTRVPVDLIRYARWANGLAPTIEPPRLLVGVRTGGGYLAPIWVSAFRQAGADPPYITVSAGHRPVVAITATECAHLSATIRLAGPVLLVDDAMMTGQTAGAVLGVLRNAGVDCAHVAIALNSSVRGYKVSRSRWRDDQLVVAPDSVTQRQRPTGAAMAPIAGQLASIGIVVQQVEPMPLTYWQRYVDAHLAFDSSEIFETFDRRPRKRRLRVTVERDGEVAVLVAKHVGIGLFGRLEHRRLAALAPFGPVPVTNAGPYLFYDWLDGRSLAFSEGVRASDVEWLARYLAVLRRTNEVERSTANRPATVRVPRGRGHWHFLRMRDGSLRKAHLDVAAWGWDVDMAEEIASVVFELGLSCADVEALVGAYEALTGDCGVGERMPRARSAMLLRLQREAAEYGAFVEAIDGHLRPSSPDVAFFAARLAAADIDGATPTESRSPSIRQHVSSAETTSCNTLDLPRMMRWAEEIADHRPPRAVTPDTPLGTGGLDLSVEDYLALLGKAVASVGERALARVQASGVPASLRELETLLR